MNLLKKLQNYFNIPSYEKEDTENSNFEFTEKSQSEKIKYVETSSGETIPYKLFNTDFNAGSNLLQQQGNNGFTEHYRIDGSDDVQFAKIERQWTENNFLSFSSGTKITSYDDVAWLFRSLENEAIEHLFMVYQFHDDSFVVQQISSGGISSAINEGIVIAAPALEMKPKGMFLVHNHPSGNLQASKADFDILSKYKDFFRDTDIEFYDGIIINVRSGKYSVFSENKDIYQMDVLSNQSQEQKNIQVYSFSKQILAEDFQLTQILDSRDVAEFITSRKYGISNKTELLVMTNRSEIAGKFILSENYNYQEIAKLISNFGGTGAIIYSNNENSIQVAKIRHINRKLRPMGMQIIDAIEVKSENAQNLFRSLAAEGIISENKNEYKSSNSVSEESSNYTNINKRVQEIISSLISEGKEINVNNIVLESLFSSGGTLANYSREIEKIISELDLTNVYTVKIFNNDTIENELIKLVNYSSLIAFLENSQFKNINSISIKNNLINFTEDINSKKEFHEFLANVWANELSKPTELSLSMTSSQIDEKEAMHSSLLRFYTQNTLKHNIMENSQNQDLESNTINENRFIVNVLTNNINPVLLHDSFDILSQESLENLKVHGTSRAITILTEINNIEVSEELVENVTNRFTSIFNKLYEEKTISSNIDENYFGGKIKDISEKAISNPDYLKQFDSDTQNVVNKYINENTDYYPKLDNNNEIIGYFLKTPKIENKIETPTLSFFIQSHITKALQEVNVESRKFDPELAEQRLTFLKILLDRKKNFSEELNEEYLKNLWSRISIEEYQPLSSLLKVNEEEIIGKITYHDSGEVMEYTSKENYFNTLKMEYETNSIGAFSNETLTNDPELIQNIKNLQLGIFGIDNTNQINNQNTDIMENSQKKQQDFEIGKFSVAKDESGKVIFRGKIQNMDDANITLENKVGEKLSTAKENVYQFFNGQKYDISEVKEILGAQKAVKFEDLSSKDLTNLMRGEYTDTSWKGVSQKEESKGKEYEFKLHLQYDQSEAKVKPEAVWKDYKFDLKNDAIFGQDLTEEQRTKLAEGEKIVIASKNNPDKSFKVGYDEKLNKILSYPYFEKKKENESHTQKNGPKL